MTEFSYPIGPSDIYSSKWQEALSELEHSGYVVEGFRPPVPGETFFSVELVPEEALWKFREPRLILRNKKLRRFVFKKCSQEEATTGDSCWIRHADGSISKVRMPALVVAPPCFVRPVEEAEAS